MMQKTAARVLIALIMLCVLTVLVVVMPARAGTDDAYSVGLLHMDGSDGSTTFTDESGKTWTANGNAQIDTAQSVFGGASGLFDGTGDTITTADSADWRLDGGSNSNLWTVDFRVRFAVDPGTGIAGLLQQRADDSNFWAIRVNNNTLSFLVRSAGSNSVDVNKAWNPAADTWYHIAVVKNGTTGYLLFVDGTQLGTTTTSVNPIPDVAGGLTIGDYVYSGSHYLNGWMDEVRISKGTARWTANFTPPTAPYPDPAATGTAAYNQTGTSNALTLEANQTGTAAALTLAANQTGTAAAIQTSSAAELTATAAYYQTQTAIALTETAYANQTATAAALTAAANVPTSTPGIYLESSISYSDVVSSTTILCIGLILFIGGMFFIVFRILLKPSNQQ